VRRCTTTARGARLTGPPLAGEPRERARDQIRGEVERPDLREPAGELPQGKSQQGGRRDAAEGSQLRRLGLALGGPQEPRGLGARRGQDALSRRLPVDVDALRRGCLVSPPPLVLTTLGDQLLLAHRELDLRLQLVLPDGALPLHRDRAPLEGGPVGVLLHLLPGRCLQCALDIRLRPHRDDAHVDDGDAGLRSLGSSPSALATRSRTAPGPAASASGRFADASSANACCCASSASSDATCSSGLARHSPVSGSMLKSSRAAATAGSTTR
jgi:hypothetical protein